MILESETNKDVFDKVVELGYSKIVATIVSKRIDDPNLVKDILEPTHDVMPPISRLLDTDKAANIIYNHIIKGSNIVAITDSDSDGVSSAATIFRSMVEYFNHDTESLHILVNERKYGNGVNDEMVKRTLKIHDTRPVDLVITADHGSNDDERFEIFKKHNIDIVVTDHHQIPITGELKNVDAFVNPQREKDTFSRNISGCTVIYLVMQQVYELFKLGGNRLGREDNMEYIMPIMTNTILSDQMDMRDPINRYLLKKGMAIMTESTDPVWLAVREVLDVDPIVTEETISFTIAPLLNAANRLGRAYMAYEFLASLDIHTATQKLRALISMNEERKKLESEMLSIATSGVKTYLYDNSLVTLLPQGTGVAGLISQTLGERLSVPAFTFVENDDMDYVGSGRGILENIDLKKLLDDMAIKDPDMFIKRGGHPGAAGCTIRSDKLRSFMKMFDEEVVKQCGEQSADKKHIYDLEVPFEAIGDKLYDEIKKAGPYGRGYQSPSLLSTAVLMKVRHIGKPAIHTVVTLMNSDRTRKQEGFYPKSSAVSFGKLLNNKVKFIYTLGKKRYLGKSTVSPTLKFIIKDK